MQQRDGMGDSGETYLVGQDKLMRSDSYLDPKNHSVIASFAGNVANNGVDTHAVIAVFNGETDNRIIIDYNGNRVLSSFTTLDIDDFKWALIAEVDEVEAFDAAHTLANVSYGLITVTILVIVVFALWISNSISTPIVLSSKVAQRVSEGDLTVFIDVNQPNELSRLQQSMQDMINKLKTMIEHIAESAEQQTISSKKLTVIMEQTNQTMIRQHSATDQVATAMAQMSAAIEAARAGEAWLLCCCR
ncbi:HAMP domain-containing protein [Marinomonas sp. 2405UD68-3]|uniref:HAMP domain-containing protein n=1 Tax=Marinomonas sp. 2405UD68-3 TaxID=3391835 RepID=UPI0039C9ECEA